MLTEPVQAMRGVYRQAAAIVYYLSSAAPLPAGNQRIYRPDTAYYLPAAQCSFLLYAVNPHYPTTMDIFYYWRDYDADLKAGRIGWLQVSRKKLDELRERHPDWIWVFRQPKDRKGALQLLARLRWTDVPVSKLPIEKGTPAIYYDPAQSVRFADTGDEAKVADVTSIIRTKFPNAFQANFRGDAGVHPMEADLLAQLVPKLPSYTAEPFPGVRKDK